MSGVYFVDGKQHLDYDTEQNHLVPHTTSDLLYKGALKDEARSVWQGNIHVYPRRAAYRCLSGQPQSVAQRLGARRLDPGPGNRSRRCALHARRGHQPDRSTKKSSI